MHHGRATRRAREAKHGAHQHRPQALAHNGDQDVARRGSQRHADAELTGALGHEIRHDAINPDRCQREGETSEQSGERRRGLNHELLQPD